MIKKNCKSDKKNQKRVHPTIDLIREKDISPSISYIPKRSLHFILNYLLLQQIKDNQQSSSSSWLSQNHHHYFLFQYYKNFQLKSRLKGLQLSELKTE